MPTATSQRIQRWFNRLVFCTPLIALAWYLGVEISRGRHAAINLSCQGNLCGLSLAMLQYKEQHGEFPPANMRKTPNGPAVSWRVLLLEFLSPALLDDYRFEEPWDGPSNRQLISRMPSIYQCPASGQERESGTTNYFVVTGRNMVFPEDHAVSIKDIRGNPSSRILIVEAVGRTVPWTQPVDLKIDSMSTLIKGPANTGWGISSHHGDFANVAFLNGETGRLRNGLSDAAFFSLFRID
jgi:hypothetical protein